MQYNFCYEYSYLLYFITYYIGDPPKLATVFKEVITLAIHWKTIRLLLHMPKHTLDRIKRDESVINDQLQEMLSEWLKQTEPLPTWSALADAVEVIDSTKAEEIRKRCIENPEYHDVI